MGSDICEPLIAVGDELAEHPRATDPQMTSNNTTSIIMDAQKAYLNNSSASSSRSFLSISSIFLALRTKSGSQREGLAVAGATNRIRRSFGAFNVLACARIRLSTIEPARWSASKLSIRELFTFRLSIAPSTCLQLVHRRLRVDGHEAGKGFARRTPRRASDKLTAQTHCFERRCKQVSPLYQKSLL